MKTYLVCKRRNNGVHMTSLRVFPRLPDIADYLRKQDSSGRFVVYEVSSEGIPDRIWSGRGASQEPLVPLEKR